MLSVLGVVARQQKVLYILLRVRHHSLLRTLTIPRVLLRRVNRVSQPRNLRTPRQLRLRHPNYLARGGLFDRTVLGRRIFASFRTISIQIVHVHVYLVSFGELLR